jgi:uncharacterized membrane protein
MKSREKASVFDYRVTRLVIGIIAFAMPFVVTFISGQALSSISESYYSGARNEFVGLLFVVGSFLLAYNGYTATQSVASKIASFAAILIALCPANRDMCPINVSSIVHACSAVALLLILAYFCIGPFSGKAKIKNTKKSRRRGTVYLTCGVVMIGCVLAVAVSNAVLHQITVVTLRITYWAETVALASFGIAWMTASKAFALFADDDEKLMLFKR